MVGVFLSTSVVAATTEDSDQSPALSAIHAEWLAEVDLLLTPEERSAFLDLSHDYRRNSFIEGFWRKNRNNSLKHSLVFQQFLLCDGLIH